LRPEQSRTLSRTSEPRPETVRDFRRGQIITAARRIVASDGLDALTIAALESSLGYSRGVITYHFGGKDEIVAEVFKSVIGEIDESVRGAVLAGETFEEKVCAVVRENVRGFTESIEAGRVLLSFWGRLGSDPKARAQNAALYAKYRERAARLIAQGRAQGVLVDVDARAMAAFLVGIVLGIATQQLFDPGAIDVAAATEEACRTLLARLAPRRRASLRRSVGEIDERSTGLSPQRRTRR